MENAIYEGNLPLPEMQVYSLECIENLVQFLNLGIVRDVIVLSENVGFVRSSDRSKYYGITSKGCGCPDYLFRQSKKPNGKCKHLKLFERAVKLRARNAELAAERENYFAIEDLRDASPGAGFRPTLEAGEAI